MEQTISSDNGNPGSDPGYIPSARFSSHSSTSLRLRFHPGETPNRPSLLSTSAASSASSSSTNSSIFDSDSSRPDTPLTPPLVGKFYPRSSRKSSTVNPGENSKMPFRLKHPKEINLLKA